MIARTRVWLVLLTLALLGSVVGQPPVRTLAHVPAGASPLVIYADAPAPGWLDYSWGGVSRDFTHGSHVHSGRAAIAVTYTAAWSGLKLARITPLDVTPYDTLRFWIHGGTRGNQQISVGIQIPHVVEIDQQVRPRANTWTRVDVRLGAVAQPQVTAVQWFNDTNGAQPTFYLDDIAFVDSGAPRPKPLPPVPGPDLSVDATAGLHAISPLIYGINGTHGKTPDANQDPLVTELHVPVRRLGGTPISTYNWRLDTANRGVDWYYQNIPEDNPNPDALPDGSIADRFVEQNRSTGTQSLLTIPMIGWTPKARALGCSFSVRKYGPQQAVAPDNPDCGNGIKPDGKTLITGNNPRDGYMPITPAFVQDWIHHLDSTFGPAAKGGVQFYDLDNEPMLWDSTHRDIHPAPTSYDELRDRTIQYASALKDVDPGAKTLGPVEWGWSGYFWSAKDTAAGASWWQHPPDRLAHGNEPFTAWYLQQMRAYEQQHGRRILDYLDLHYYPAAPGVSLTGATDAANQALRLRSTRSLWDPTYVDESWINQPVLLIPRMRAWVNRYYPGTKLAISEYNWGALDTINGALAQADVLGIFGREGLDLATLWNGPQPSDPGAFAFRMYLNYDGAGHGFGETSVQAASGNQDRVAMYAARRGDGALTLIVINKTDRALTSRVSLAHFSPAAHAQIYQYSPANLEAIVRRADRAVAAGGFSATWPASSITLVLLRKAL